MSNQPPYLPTALGASKTTLLLGNNLTSGPYAWQLPQCNITSNPYSGGGYGGTTGIFGLLNCIAIQNGALSAVVWFYEPPGGQGVLLGTEVQQYPSSNPYYSGPALYVGEDGSLYALEVSISTNYYVNTPNSISPGWHMAVFEEWAASTSGPYYLALYLDGQLVGQTSMSASRLFGIDLNAPQAISNIGLIATVTFPETNGTYYFFNGNIAYVALYNRVLTTSDVLAIYQGIRITSGLVAEYIGNNYDPSTGVWTDSSGNNYNITTTVVAGQYPPRGCTLWPVGDSGNWINWPTC